MDAFAAQFASLPENSFVPETPEECIQALLEGTQRLGDVKKSLRRVDVDEQWIDEFVEQRGLEHIWNILESCAQYPERSKTTAMLKCIECTKAACAKPTAMNYFIRTNFVGRLVNGIHTCTHRRSYNYELILLSRFCKHEQFTSQTVHAYCTSRLNHHCLTM